MDKGGQRYCEITYINGDVVFEKHYVKDGNEMNYS